MLAAKPRFWWESYYSIHFHVPICNETSITSCWAGTSIFPSMRPNGRRTSFGRQGARQEYYFGILGFVAQCDHQSSNGATDKVAGKQYDSSKKAQSWNIAALIWILSNAWPNLSRRCNACSICTWMATSSPGSP